jgi:purine-binding chemotaxis protein CheW
MSVIEIAESTQYLSFNLGDEVFALDIGKVREVLEFTTVTKVPQTPDYMRGVINLRGGIVPVVDMRLKFGMDETEKAINTCVIITEVELDGGETTVIGALADSVQEVFDMHADDIEPAPRLGTQLNTEFLKGMGKKGDEFVLILDIDRIFSQHEIDVIAKTEDSLLDEKSVIC